MKQYLISPDKKQYKANLHCHSTLSDGRLTPEALKELYQNHGYDILAITDHEMLIPHDELNDPNFLCLHGFEMDVGEAVKKPFKAKRSCHIGLIALSPEQRIQPCYHREKYVYPDRTHYRALLQYDRSLPDYVRDISPAGITDIMEKAAEQGFFVVYNHPTWGMQTYEEYTRYFGMHAVEIFNGGSLVQGYDDVDTRVFDDLLRKGRRVSCIGADDNHNLYQAGDPLWDSGLAFTMILAPSLDYCAVTDALMKGNFYASTGPLIEKLWLEDGRIHIRCSAAASVRCNYGVRRAEIAYAQKEPLKEAVFTLLPDDLYFRITVIDKQGKKACTNGYFTEDIYKGED